VRVVGRPRVRRVSPWRGGGPTSRGFAALGLVPTGFAALGLVPTGFAALGLVPTGFAALGGLSVTLWGGRVR
jgi:hypothetical protein